MKITKKCAPEKYNNGKKQTIRKIKEFLEEEIPDNVTVTDFTVMFVYKKV